MSEVSEVSVSQMKVKHVVSARIFLIECGIRASDTEGSPNDYPIR